MNPTLLFLAPYPNSENIKDGMFSRIKAIDNFFINDKRIYLEVSSRRYFKQRILKEPNLFIYQLNIFVHFFLIIKILYNSNYIYIHSINTLRILWILLLFFSRKKICLDLHGIVPEEFKMNKKIFLATYSLFVEKIAFHLAKNVICVTNAMAQYYKNKYTTSNANYIIYSIMPTWLKSFQEEDIPTITSNKIKVIYSGGTQVWQNIDLMLTSIANYTFSNVEFSILTGNKAEFEKLILKYNIQNKVSIKSFPPEELWKEYLTADYAFILRSDSLVNKLANPTKLVEYMYYGITPIVLTPDIGDYMDLKYEYIKLNAFFDGLIKVSKSSQNMHIINELLSKNKRINIRDVLFS